MTRFTDGKMVADIEMKMLDWGGYSPCFEHDFFNCGSLRHNKEFDCYEVDDVVKLVNVARKWESESVLNEAYCEIYFDWKYTVNFDGDRVDIGRYLSDVIGCFNDTNYEWLDWVYPADNSEEAIKTAVDTYFKETFGFIPKYKVAKPERSGV